MISKHTYILRFDDKHIYHARIDFERGSRRVTIHGCELYTPKGDYVGYWDSHNISLKMLEVMRDFIRAREPITHK